MSVSYLPLDRLIQSRLSILNTTPAAPSPPPFPIPPTDHASRTSKNARNQVSSNQVFSHEPGDTSPPHLQSLCELQKPQASKKPSSSLDVVSTICISNASYCMPNPHVFIVCTSFFVILVTDNKSIAWVKPVTHKRALSLAAVPQELTSTYVEILIKKPARLH